MTTMSTGFAKSPRTARNTSRNRRLIWFRAVARFSSFVVTAIARRLVPASEGMNRTRKCLQWILAPVFWHRAISDLFRKRASDPRERELTIVPLALMLLDRDPLAALRTTGVEDLAATLRGASLTEAVGCSAALFAWLVRTFHSELPINRFVIVFALVRGVNLGCPRRSRAFISTPWGLGIQSNKYRYYR
jgi:hypothetical protein